MNVFPRPFVTAVAIAAAPLGGCGGEVNQLSMQISPANDFLQTRQIGSAFGPENKTPLIIPIPIEMGKTECKVSLDFQTYDTRPFNTRIRTVAHMSYVPAIFRN